jgi:hypothetical protein
MWDLIGSLVSFIAVMTCKLLCCLLYIDDMYGVEIVPINYPDEIPPPGLERLKSLLAIKEGAVVVFRPSDGGAGRRQV